MNKYMRIERKREDHWEETNMWDLKKGNRFRMFYPETGEPFIGDDNLTEWIVKGKPYTQEIDGEDIWTVNIE
jgi:hypothetical protein